MPDSTDSKVLPTRGTSLIAFLLIAVALCLWSSAFVAIRVAVEAYSPGHLALFRFLIASAAMALAAPLFRVGRPRLRDLPAFFGMGFSGVAFYTFAVNAGERTVTAGAASLIIASETVFVAVLAGVFLKERVARRAWVGFAISLVGVGLISFGSGEGVRVSPDAWLLAAASVAAASCMVLQKPYLRRYKPMEVSAYTVWTGTLLLLFAWPGLPEAVVAAEPRYTRLVVFLGLGPGALAYTAWTYSLRYAPVSVVSTALFLISPLTVVIAWILLAELPSATALLGGVVVLLGVAVAGRR